MTEPMFTDQDVQNFVDVASDDQIKQAVQERGLTPATRQTIVIVLAFVALGAMAAVVWLTLADKPASEAFLAIASACVGGIAGVAMPRSS